MLSPNHGLANKRNGPWAVPKSSESSHTETFSLQKSKKSDTCSLFFGICIANAIECALMRGYSKIDIVLIVKEKANRRVRLFVCR